MRCEESVIVLYSAAVQRLPAQPGCEHSAIVAEARAIGLVR